MKQRSWAARWRSARSESEGTFSPENATAGRSVTTVIAVRPSASLPRTPPARSSYRSTRNPRPAARERNQSMWQEERDATNASSGSTARSSESGSGTTAGEEDAGTSRPPSKDHAWSRR